MVARMMLITTTDKPMTSPSGFTTPAGNKQKNDEPAGDEPQVIFRQHRMVRGQVRRFKRSLQGSVPQNMIVAKEIEIRGSFRFHEEFGLAVDLINQKRVDLKPLLTEVLPLQDAEKAFQLAGDRARAMKVQIAF